jgi:hypothetical protein
MDYLFVFKRLCFSYVHENCNSYFARLPTRLVFFLAPLWGVPSTTTTFSFCPLPSASIKVLLGDAVHSVKPYFGLGANSAFEDVTVLQVIDHQARALGLSPRLRVSLSR